jgi:hypothetical protein
MSETENKVIELTDKDLTLMEMLDQWLAELVFPGKIEDFIQCLEGSGDDKNESKRRICFYTEEHQYFITAIDKPEGKNYLGCQVSTRKARAGEDWTRGNDLPDGLFNKETWKRIVYAIVNYELVKLSKYQKPDIIPEDVA